ncbi:MAG: phosphatidylglycerophosphatase A [bacterium]|nr:phosphatidylglycerophosphatase A [bacterium]
MVATGLGTGYSPVAPGTVGTLAAIPLYLALAPAGVIPYLAILAGVVLIGVYAADHMEKALRIKDPGLVVIDEIAGYLVTMFLSPPDILHVAAGFFLFRFFDIFKPPPVRQAERFFPGGLGIMADDLLAGVYAWAGLRIMEVLFL